MADLNNKEVIFVSVEHVFQFLNEKFLVVSLEGMKAFYEGQGHIR
jgi:hypothetical protein